MDIGFLRLVGLLVGVVLGAGLGGEGEGELLAAGLSNHHILLVDHHAAVLPLGHAEALARHLVGALHLGDDNGLGDADLLGGRVGQLALLCLGHGDQGHAVGLGLILLATDLVLAGAVVGVAVAGGPAVCFLHRLGLLLEGDLGGGAGRHNVLTHVLKGAELPVHGGAGLLAHGEGLVEAVLAVHDVLGGEGDGGHAVREGRHAHLGVDGGVGVPAVVVGGVGGGGMAVAAIRGHDCRCGQGNCEYDGNLTREQTKLVLFFIT